MAGGYASAMSVRDLLSWPTLAGLALAAIAVFGTAALAWRLLVSGGGGRRLPVHIALEHVGMLQIGKYVPGKIFGIVARASEPVAGFSTRAFLGATLHEQLLSIGCTLLVGATLAITATLTPWLAVMLMLVVVPAISVAVYPFAWRVAAGVAMRVARRASDDLGALAEPSMRTTAGVAFAFTLQWLAVGGLVALMLESQSSDLSSWLAVTSAYALATIGGMLTLVVPGGIGVREVLFVGLAAPAIGQPMAITLAAMLRLVLSAMDLLGGMLAIGIRRARG
jgi:hypothetical protein